MPAIRPDGTVLQTKESQAFGPYTWSEPNALAGLFGHGTLAVNLVVAPGESSVDTNVAGALSLGGLNATAVDVDPDLQLSSHLVSLASGTPATSVLGTNVTSVTFTGNDTRGTIAIVMSGAGTANASLATCTFAVSYGATAPKITLVNQTSAVGLTIVSFYVLSQATGVSFTLASDQALAAGTYIVDYIVIG